MILEYTLAFYGGPFSGYWCDGILNYSHNVKTLAKSEIVKHKCINTKAWFGPSGQEEYDMTLILGPKSLKAYLKNGDLATCIPDENLYQWVDIDAISKNILVRLY